MSAQPVLELFEHAPEYVHGIVSDNPWNIRCDGCDAEASGLILGVLVFTCGIVFNPRLPDDDRRLCKKCRVDAGWGVNR